jgi:rod shape-determining protein MreC
LICFVIAVLVLGGFGIYGVFTGGDGYLSPIQNVIGMAAVPFEQAVTWVSEKTESVTDYIGGFDALQAENERLRSQLASMEDTIRAAELTLEENAFLREFLSLKESHNDYRFLKCEIVASDASAGYRRTLTLNAGTVEGAAIGYPVITPSGVVGRITEVGGNWAKAEPITELSSAIGAYVERSGDSGVAEGSYLYRDAGKLLLNYLEEDADIVIGDRIRTSGVNSYYPRGLLIGEVTELLTDPATGIRSAVITPTSALSDLRDVMVLTDFAIYDTDPEQEPSGEDTDTE